MKMNHSLVVFFISTVVVFLRSSASDVNQSDPNREFRNKFLKFEQFRVNFKKTYATPQEALHRFMTFEANLRKISELNREERGTAVYGINHMTDWTQEEFLKKLGNSKLKFNATANESKVDISEKEIDDPTVPDSFDWRIRGAVTPAKNQLTCNSCYAFASVGNIENLYAIKYGKQSFFSEQQLVDCDEAQYGCGGADHDFAQTMLASVIDTGGLDYEASYPYEAQEGACRFKSDAVGVRVAKLNELVPLDEKAMAKYISSTSSTMNGINPRMLQHYLTGIMDPPPSVCDQDSWYLAHVVLTVGYGVHSETEGIGRIPYWVMKNSWGEHWGERGFFKIKRGSNTCGLAQLISAAVLA